MVHKKDQMKRKKDQMGHKRNQIQKKIKLQIILNQESQMDNN